MKTFLLYLRSTAVDLIPLQTRHRNLASLVSCSIAPQMTITHAVSLVAVAQPTGLSLCVHRAGEGRPDTAIHNHRCLYRTEQNVQYEEENLHV